MLKERSNWLDYLNEIAERYTSKNRSFEYTDDQNTRCLYFGPKDTCCAIGFKLDRTEWLGRYLDQDVAQLFEQYGTPEFFEDMDIEFLMDCQSLHDEDRNWNEEGLTSVGKTAVDFIKNDWDLN